MSNPAALAEPVETGDVATTGNGVQHEPFVIDSDHRAEWLLRKLANIEAERTRVTAQAAEIVKQLDSDAERLRFLFGQHLESYCRSKLAASGNRRRSVTFLQGTCAFRTIPAGVRIWNPYAALLHAKTALPDAIRTAVTLNSAAYREMAAKLLEETGECLPGIETTPERESFSIKTS